MKNTKFFTLLLMIVVACFAATLNVKNIVTTTTSYRLVYSDSDTLLNVTPSSDFTIIVPVEIGSKDTFQTGTKIYGSSLTDYTVLITGDKGVTIINPDNAFRTRHLGSQWTLTKIKRNVWLLEGDLYSTEIDAYIGDDVTIKAEVDPNATGPFTFTWYKNGVALTGQTNASLKLISVKSLDAGVYKVYVRNDAGYATSETTNLLIR